MKIAYFDCIAGASGDMILGALLDCGLPEARLQQDLAALHLDGFELHSQRVVKNGFSATKVDLLVSQDVPERRLAEIEAIVRESGLEESIKERSIAIFRRLGQVEAKIHNQPLEKVHLHELGGIDTIVDVVGALAGLQALGVEKVYASALPMGRGFTRGAHGPIPLPAPATLALLEGVPITGSDLSMELVTPTGAALLTSLAESFGPLPAMTLAASGYGAGSRDLPIPNLLRVLLGEQPAPGAAQVETLVLLETNIDDLNPQIYDYLMARLFEAGALDVTLTPIQMKKNRPGTQLSVLCHPAGAGPLGAILFAETSTLGVRKQTVERQALERTITSVDTPYGRVRIKVARLAGGGVKSAPEYEDCRILAEARGVPLREVYRAAELAAGKIPEEKP